MTNFDFLALAPSSEFIALCQTQVALLTQGLGAAWSAVYITQGLTADSSEAKLFPIAVYPKTQADWRSDRLAPLLPQFFQRADPPRLLAATSTMSSVDSSDPVATWGEHPLIPNSQIVLPLIYQEEIMGVLVTRRDDRQWNQSELAQIDKIAQTLAIARLLDQRQSKYQQQLQKQYQSKRIERDKLDNLFHQLRNPLTALRTFSKLLLKRLLPEDRNHKVAQSILRESDRLQELLQQFEQDQEEESGFILKQAAAVTALPEASSSLIPETALRLEPLSVPTILEPLITSAEAIAQEQGIELKANIPNGLPPIQADSRAIREVLNNLLDNAIKYTPPGGKVVVQAGREQVTAKGTWQGIAIEDTGYGIPAAEQERIFERHYRGTQANSSISGSGLGLAIAKELVEKMQGKIELISPNQLAAAPFQAASLAGTTFIVWLPIATAAKEAI